jgi:hypothetical protein
MYVKYGAKVKQPERLWNGGMMPMHGRNAQGARWEVNLSLYCQQQDICASPFPIEDIKGNDILICDSRAGLGP